MDDVQCSACGIPLTDPETHYLFAHPGEVVVAVLE
jgi:hypothetical protein